MSIPNPNSIPIKVIKTTSTDAPVVQPATFSAITSLTTSTRPQDLHPKVKTSSEAKTTAPVEPIKTQPKALLIPKENGVFEIHVTCSCGETHIIECETIPSA